jgi:hypothetical protein
MTDAPRDDAPRGGDGGFLLALFVTVACAYVVTAPGRFETVDTQFRYDVARGLLDRGRPSLSDPALLRMPFARPGLHGERYSVYSAMGSLVGIPLLLVARALGDPTGELGRFLFSLGPALFGAATVTLVARVCRDLGATRARALGAALALAFASLLWPMAASAFDNAQHAFFALATAWLAWRSAERSSPRLALAAGLAAAALLNFQEAYGVMILGLALPALGPLRRPDARREGLVRYLLVGLGASLGLIAWTLWNILRFGDPLYAGKADTAAMGTPAVWGNPLVGALSLLLSPGKSVLLFSPTALLGILGWRALRDRAPGLAVGVLAASGLQLALVSSLQGFTGDWCWGPRYVTVLLPLWALPVALLDLAPRRRLVGAVVLAGLTVQGLALSVETTRFFTERRLDDYFWARDRWFYFSASQLVDRPAELAAVVTEPVPATARYFAPTIREFEYTGATMRAWTPAEGPAAMRFFTVYHVPRPWPFWMRHVPAERLPFAPGPAAVALLAVGALGAVALRRSLREASA